MLDMRDRNAKNLCSGFATFSVLFIELEPFIRNQTVEEKPECMA